MPMAMAMGAKSEFREKRSAVVFMNVVVLCACVRCRTRDRLDALGNAKLRIAMAYGISSLYYMLLRTQGENPLQHPVKGELDRIKGYVQKTQKVRGEKGVRKE